MKPKPCSCCKLVYLQKIRRAWVCCECDRTPRQDQRTIGQWMTVLELTYKYAGHQRGEATNDFMRRACEPEVSMMQERAKQIKEYKRRHK